MADESFKTLMFHMARVLGILSGRFRNLYIKAKRAGVVPVQPHGVNAKLLTYQQRVALLYFIVLENFPKEERPFVVRNRVADFETAGIVVEKFGVVYRKVAISAEATQSILRFGTTAQKGGNDERSETETR